MKSSRLSPSRRSQSHRSPSRRSLSRRSLSRRSLSRQPSRSASRQQSRPSPSRRSASRQSSRRSPSRPSSRRSPSRRSRSRRSRSRQPSRRSRSRSPSRQPNHRSSSRQPNRRSSSRQSSRPSPSRRSASRQSSRRSTSRQTSLRSPESVQKPRSKLLVGRHLRIKHRKGTVDRRGTSATKTFNSIKHRMPYSGTFHRFPPSFKRINYNPRPMTSRFSNDELTSPSAVLQYSKSVSASLLLFKVSNKNFIKNHLNSLVFKTETVAPTVALLRKHVVYRGAPVTLLKFMDKVCDSKFLTEHLPEHLSDMSQWGGEIDSTIRDEYVRIIENLSVVFEYMLDKFPQKSTTTLQRILSIIQRTNVTLNVLDITCPSAPKHTNDRRRRYEEFKAKRQVAKRLKLSADGSSEGSPENSGVSRDSHNFIQCQSSASRDDIRASSIDATIRSSNSTEVATDTDVSTSSSAKVAKHTDVSTSGIAEAAGGADFSTSGNAETAEDAGVSSSQRSRHTNESTVDHKQPRTFLRSDTVQNIENMLYRCENPEKSTSFRHQSVAPDFEDTRRQRQLPDANITDGPHKSLEHYLHTHYTLLREDFFRPFQKGFEAYQKQDPTRDIVIYRGVKIIHFMLPEDDGLCYRIQLPRNQRLQRDRLKYGSLVCLSSTEFKTMPIIFGTVQNTDNLATGRQLQIQLLHDCGDELSSGDPNITYTMAESGAFFEPYHRVLKGLQQIGSTMPFQKTIVNLKLARQPTYVIKSAHDLKFDFRVLCGKTRPIFAKKVTLTDFETWPTAEEMKLNTSQLEAMQHALTSEVALIQGPPGTGKTYVSLKIAKVLLDNNKFTALGKGGPILVVCHSNHALDQFLEGMLRFCPNIVRVGGRSKSQKLKNYNLAAKRKTFRSCNEMMLELKTARDKIKSLQFDILHLQRQLRYCKEGVLSSRELQDSMSPHQIQYFTDQANTVSKWLRCHKFVEYRWSQSLNVTEPISKEVKTQQGKSMTPRRFKTVIEKICVPAKAVGHEFYLGGYLPKNGETPSPMDQRVNGIRQNIATGARLIESYDGYLDNLNISTRWEQYRYWLAKYVAGKREELKKKEQQVLTAAELLQERKQERDKQILRSCSVIGLTTSCAAKNRNILQDIRPRIVIVEEAAEVLESHIITTLSDGCQHLILVGDHQQLRPKTADYSIETKCKLNMSLFERLVTNGVQSVRLTEQHRMSPEISCLLQHIYTDPPLLDHPRVTKYPPVRGVEKRCFFIHHTVAEEGQHDTKLKSNMHEALFIAALTKYLRQQDYEPKQITVLTPYNGQKRLLEEHIKTDYQTSEVRIATVDDYQGEENDVILVSLVRSNSKGIIGFLKDENRMCVLLSRAKHGMYVIGNFEQLASKHDMWQKMVTTMKENDSYGESMRIHCDNHKDDSAVDVTTAEDFAKRQEGGCGRPCKELLPKCKHECPIKVCHNYDRKHEHILCPEKCQRIVCVQHKTTCTHTCSKPCSECRVMVLKTLSCEHQKDMPCSVDPRNERCHEPCTEILQPCGHRCPNKCSERCADKCNAETDIQLQCGHLAQKRCSDTSVPKCGEQCGTKLDCQHTCQGSCHYDCSEDRIHMVCQEKCNKVLVCGHQCPEQCHDNQCPPCKQPCENRCRHTKCDLACGKICQPCTKPCAWECRHYKCIKKCHLPCERKIKFKEKCKPGCQHDADCLKRYGRICVECKEPCAWVCRRKEPPCLKSCHRNCNGQRCPKLCGKKLKCGHICSGFCGEICPINCDKCKGQSSQTLAKSVYIQLEDCDHSFPVAELDKWMEIIPEDTMEPKEPTEQQTNPNTQTDQKSADEHTCINNEVEHDVTKSTIGVKRASDMNLEAPQVQKRSRIDLLPATQVQNRSRTDLLPVVSDEPMNTGPGDVENKRVGVNTQTNDTDTTLQLTPSDQHYARLMERETGDDTMECTDDLQMHAEVKKGVGNKDLFGQNERASVITDTDATDSTTSVKVTVSAEPAAEHIIPQPVHVVNAKGSDVTNNNNEQNVTPNVNAAMDIENRHTSPAAQTALKKCPICGTPIRRSFRYNAILKKQHYGIQREKKSILDRERHSHSKLKEKEYRKYNWNGKPIDSLSNAQLTAIDFTQRLEYEIQRELRAFREEAYEDTESENEWRITLEDILTLEAFRKITVENFERLIKWTTKDHQHISKQQAREANINRRRVTLLACWTNLMYQIHQHMERPTEEEKRMLGTIQARLHSRQFLSLDDVQEIAAQLRTTAQQVLGCPFGIPPYDPVELTPLVAHLNQ